MSDIKQIRIPLDSRYEVVISKDPIGVIAMAFEDILDEQTLLEVWRFSAKKAIEIGNAFIDVSNGKEATHTPLDEPELEGHVSPDAPVASFSKTVFNDEIREGYWVFRRSNPEDKGIVKEKGVDMCLVEWDGLLPEYVPTDDLQYDDIPF